MPGDGKQYRAESLLGASLAGRKKYAEAEPLPLGNADTERSNDIRPAAQDKNQLASCSCQSHKSLAVHLALECGDQGSFASAMSCANSAEWRMLANSGS